MITKQTSDTKPLAHKQRKTATEEPPWNDQQENYWGLKLVSLSRLIVLGFNDTSTLEGHFVSSPREREKRDRRE